jgi:disulfide bond formation protein DsbB
VHDTPTFVMALLALIGFVGTAVLGLAAVGGRWSPALAGLVADWRPLAAPVAAVVAMAATASSLWFSEVWHWVPCRLCWYQRIAMYPLALLIPWSLVRRTHVLDGAFVAIAAIGLAIATWHWLIEHHPSLADSASCEPTAPCTAIWFEHLGFVTIPGGAGLSFATIAVQLLLARPTAPPEAYPEEIT